MNVFDNKNRLISEIRIGLDAYSCSYAYDLNDSLIYRDLPGGGNVTFELDVMQKITGGGYIWDTDGRLLSRTVGGASVTFAYDYADRATGMTVGSGSSALTLAYHYDGDGGLQWLQRNGMRSQFLLDGRDVLREWLPLTITRSTNTVALRPRDLVRLNLNVLSQQVVDYTHGVGLISQRVTTLTTTPQTYSTDFFRWDGRATSRRQEDGSGSDANDTVFDAYGLLRSPKTLTSAYGFVGEEGVRQEKGQAPELVVPYHMRARMYDPLLGRFTSRDPVWDVNLYEYGRDNPWSNIDPLGMQADQLSSDYWLRQYEAGSTDPAYWQRRMVESASKLRQFVTSVGGPSKITPGSPAQPQFTLLDVQRIAAQLRYQELAPIQGAGPLPSNLVPTGRTRAAQVPAAGANPGYDWKTVAESAAKNLAVGVGIGVATGAAVAAGIVTAPFLGVAAGLVLGGSALYAGARRREEASEAGHTGAFGRAMLAGTGDVFGITPTIEGLTHRDVMTGSLLGVTDASRRLGGGLGSLGALGLGPSTFRLGGRLSATAIGRGLIDPDLMPSVSRPSYYNRMLFGSYVTAEGQRLSGSLFSLREGIAEYRTSSNVKLAVEASLLRRGNYYHILRHFNDVPGRLTGGGSPQAHGVFDPILRNRMVWMMDEPIWLLRGPGSDRVIVINQGASARAYLVGGPTGIEVFGQQLGHPQAPVNVLNPGWGWDLGWYTYVADPRTNSARTLYPGFPSR